MTLQELVDYGGVELDCCELCGRDSDDLYDVPTVDGPLIVCGPCREVL